MNRLEVERKLRIDRRKPEWRTFEWTRTGWRQDAFWFNFRQERIQEKRLPPTPMQSSDIVLSPSVGVVKIGRSSMKVFTRDF